MYIPKEILWFLIGFIFFPIVCYAVMEIKDNKKGIQNERKNEKSSDNINNN